MGFLSAYDTVRRVPIPHPDPAKEYWVDLREHISLAKKDQVDRALANNRQTVDQATRQVTIAPDYVSWRHQLILAHIADWNLDDAEGKTWPINEQYVKQLPSDIFDLLFQIVNEELAAPASKEEQRRFPDGGGSGDPLGEEGRPAVAAGVPAADGTAPAAGDDPAGVHGAPAA